jgi:hypothetical protein
MPYTILTESQMKDDAIFLLEECPTLKIATEGEPLFGNMFFVSVDVVRLDEESVSQSKKNPTSMVWYPSLSYHRVRCMIAHGFIRFCHVDTKNNVSDVMTKALGFTGMWPFIQPLLFLRGDTNQPLIPSKKESPVSANIGE